MSRMKTMVVVILFIYTWLVIYVGISKTLLNIPLVSDVSRLTISDSERSYPLGSLLAIAGACIVLLFTYMGYKFSEDKHWSLSFEGIVPYITYINRDRLIHSLEIHFKIIEKIDTRIKHDPDNKGELELIKSGVTPID